MRYEVKIIQMILLCRTIFATILTVFTIFSILCHPSLAAEQQGEAELQHTNLEVEPKSILLASDCHNCHNNIVMEVNFNGGAHRSKVNCTECHDGHPPSKRDIIPRCSKCHKQKDAPHFGLDNCLKCHTNPHTPLQITLTRDITYPCTTCHESQIIELKENPSIHTSLDCTACHTKHGLLPECFACHGPHQEGMSNQDCLACHKPHMPLVIFYGQEIPSEFCGSCHTDAYSQLGNSNAKHKNVACTLCHEAKHKMVPKCSKCHDQPHSKSIHEKFNSCSICHGLAHNLKLNEVDMFLENR